MTQTQEILAAAAGVKSVKAGDLIALNVDIVLGNDITTPVAINEFEKAGFHQVFDKEKIVFVLDHFTPNKDIAAAIQCKQIRDFAKKYGIVNFFDVGEVGVEHALLPEKGIVSAGDVVIGADSHTCTYGALGAFSTGVGSTDMACGMATGKAWFKVPSAIKVRLTGKMNKWVSGKDVVLHLIGILGVSGALYKSVEFCGDGVKSLTMDDRLCICNMGIECGAKNAIFPVDECTLQYLNEHTKKQIKIFEADEDAEYDRVIDIDLSKVPLSAACPSLPDNVKPVSEIKGVAVDQVVIGSCTNGRISDMRAAAEIFKGRKVAAGVRAIIIPATQKIYMQCIKEGLTEIFVEAGCAVSTPTCGPCLGGHMGILAPGEVAVATTNRNFVGRMGHVTSKVYLASPAVAAATAVMGRVASPEEL